jgi:hypothetical protein
MPQEYAQHELVEKQIQYHGKAPSHSDEMGGFYLIVQLPNYPYGTGTRLFSEKIKICDTTYIKIARFAIVFRPAI